MTEVINTAAQDGEQANPYKRNKPWHDDGPRVETPDSDSLFFPDKPAPATTKEPAKEADTSKEAQVAPANTEQVHDWEQRYKDLRSYTDRNKGKVQSEAEVIPETTKTPETPEDILALKESNPEEFAKIEKLARYFAQQEGTDVKEQLASIKQKEAGITRDKSLATIQTAHSDFQDVVNSDAFEVWAATKSKKMRDAIYRNPDDPQAAIEVLDLYKLQSAQVTQENESNQQENQEAVDASSLISSRNVSGSSESTEKTWKRSEIARMRPDELIANIDSINTAQAAGLILDQ